MKKAVPCSASAPLAMSPTKQIALCGKLCVSDTPAIHSTDWPNSRIWLSSVPS